MTRAVLPDQGPGRPRSQSTRDAILKATWAIIEEDGLDSLSIEGVAARAAVGKTTIYRWWTNKRALAVEAFLVEVSPALAFPNTGSAREDIGRQMVQLARVYRGKTGRIVCEMIGNGQFDRETLRLFYEGYLLPRRAAAKAVLQRGVDQGEFKSDIDFEAVIDALYAPLFHRVLIGHASNNAKFLAFLADTVLTAISTHGRR